MAAHPAAKAIDTQEITEKAVRDLLQLLEAVRTHITVMSFTTTTLD